MFNASRFTIAAVALASAISVAAAADTGMSKSTTGSGAMSQSTSNAMAKDSLSLTSAERKIAWTGIRAQAIKEKTPSGFSVRVGARLPSDITIHPVPVSIANKVRELRSYQYALLDSNKLLIVNPADNRIAEVITR